MCIFVMYLDVLSCFENCFGFFGCLIIVYDFVVDMVSGSVLFDGDIFVLGVFGCVWFLFWAAWVAYRNAIEPTDDSAIE